jgi:hypothetical protein
MSCCGKEREALGYEFASASAGVRTYFADAVEFEYVGQGELTVIGPLTGTTYRFSADRRRQRVEGHDAPSLAYVPGLKAIH